MAITDPQWWLLRGALLSTLLLAPIEGIAQQLRPREFRPGSLHQIEQLPASRLRTQINALPSPARQRSLQWLQSFHFTEDDLPALHVDTGGGIYFVCPAVAAPAVAPAATPDVAEASVPITPFPSHLVFQSRPGAPNTLFLNFSGERISGTEWNTDLGRPVILAEPYSTDFDLSTFNDSEQAAIKRIWQRVAEDYAPFNINVTTQRPTTFTTRTAHALITRSTDASGEPNPASNAGGVAYVNVFGTLSFGKYRPGWVYADNLANDESYISEAASHEIGHNLGLSHDGATDGSEYYSGHGNGDSSWGAIMGNSYDRNVSQWSKGEYRSSNNTQDDLATLAGKVTYRNDDHGNTAANATALVLTGGTQIESTTPETDPTNLNPANKGVLGRNTDFDMFSFVTGAGPIQLSVNPWIMPLGGTHGGNLDVLLELRNTAGTLLLTNNSASRTIALLETNLPAGRYYLTVRNSGAGNPLGAFPTGYTSYGSIGQYFINGSVTAATGLIIPPLAELLAGDLTTAGQTALLFTVTYADDIAVDVATLDSQDIRVTGPNNFDRLAQFMGVEPAVSGSTLVATYSLAPPDGLLWSSADNGTYTVGIRANAVADTAGAKVPEGPLGRFEVTVPKALYLANMDESPGWRLDSQWAYGAPRYPTGGPTNGFTGSKIIGYNLGGNYGVRLSNRYAVTPVIDCSSVSSVSLRFKRWLRVHSTDTVTIQVSTNGTTWAQVWSPKGGVSDTSWQEVQYPLPDGVPGSATVRIRWGLASGADSNVDIGWNIDDVEVIGAGFLDTKPPAAQLSVADLTVRGSPSHSCSVTYTDETSVRLSSLDSTDLRVTGPNGYSQLIPFEGADLPLDGSPITASYSIPAPGTSWNPGDNGTYIITLVGEAVEDTLSFTTPETVLGSFQVAIPLAEPGVLEVTPVEGWSAVGPQGGPFVPSTKEYSLANRGGSALTWTAETQFDWIALFAAQGTLDPGQSVPIAVSLQANATTLTAGSFAGWVSFVNATSGLGNSRRNLDLNVLGAQNFQLRINLNEPSWGNVMPSGGDFPADSSVKLQAVPALYFRFRQWDGDASGASNPLTLVVSKDLAVLAVFEEILTTQHPTPHWWLAAQGYTQDFEMAVDLIGANDLPVWQSYVAGLNPNDPASRLVLTSASSADDSNVVLSWTTVSGKTYTLRSSLSVSGAFTPVLGAVDMPSTTRSMALPVAPGSLATYYRIEVK